MEPRHEEMVLGANASSRNLDQLANQRLFYTSIYSTVSNDPISCPHMPEDTFSHELEEAHISNKCLTFSKWHLPFARKWPANAFELLVWNVKPGFFGVIKKNEILKSLLLFRSCRLNVNCFRREWMAKMLSFKLRLWKPQQAKISLIVKIISKIRRPRSDCTDPGLEISYALFLDKRHKPCLKCAGAQADLVRALHINFI